MEFTQIPNKHLILGYEEAVLIAVIDSWYTNKKKKGTHYKSQQQYCEKYYIKSRKYFTILKKLKDYGIVTVTERLANNRQVLKIDHSELTYVLDKLHSALDAQRKLDAKRKKKKIASSALPPCTKGTASMHNMQGDNASNAQLECTKGTTQVLDKGQYKVTKEETKKDTKPEEFSFDIFKEEVKKEDTNLKDEIMVMSLLDELDI